MKKSFSRISESSLNEVVSALIDVGKDYNVWTFEGNLGAGKTTLIKALAKSLNIEDEVSSPTFNYVNDYDGRIYHFDCYRIKNVEEALGFGFEEYIDSGKSCWIEWPDVIKPLLLDKYLEIIIEHNPDATRNYTVSII